MRKIIVLIFLLFSLLTAKSQVKYYINSSIGQPWANAACINAMNTVFGVGNWSQASFQTVNTNALFQPSVCFIYMEGSDNNIAGLSSFLSTNSVVLQNWVSNGGRLFLNAAPNLGGNVDFAFGGVTCNYPALSNTGTFSPGQALHPIFQGPFTPCGNIFSGNFFSHSYISAPSGTAIMTGTAGASLFEMIYGSGEIIFGGITIPFYQAPSPNTSNLKANIIAYLAGYNLTQASSNTTVLCSGESATLSASGYVGTTYSWVPIGLTGSVIVVTPTTTTSYTVISTPTVGGCSNISNAVLTISVNALPSITLTSTGTICVGGGQTATLNALGIAGTTYSWLPVNQSGTMITVTPTSTSVYTVTGTNIGGCSSQTNISVIVNTSPTLSVTSLGTICLGGNQTATLNALAPAGTTYSWLPVNQSGTMITVTPTSTTIYTVTGTSLSGCSTQTNISIAVNSSPTISVTPGGTICVGEQTVILTASGVADTYSWSSGSTSFSIGVTPITSTTYTVYGTYSLTGCTNSATTSIVVNLCTGSEQLNNIIPQFKILPNPTSGEFFIEFNNVQNKNIQITDVTGQTVASFVSEKEKMAIKINHLATGIYYIRVQTNDNVEVKKLIIQ